MTDYEENLYRDVYTYECEYGRPPRAIFMSYPLLKMFQIDMACKLTGYSDREYGLFENVVYMYHGIEVIPYRSDDFAYYLASYCCNLS